MASTIIGFRRNLAEALPAQYRDVVLKRTRLQEELALCHEDETFLRGLAAVAGVDLEAPTTEPGE